MVTNSVTSIIGKRLTTTTDIIVNFLFNDGPSGIKPLRSFLIEDPMDIVPMVLDDAQRWRGNIDHAIPAVLVDDAGKILGIITGADLVGHKKK